MLIDKMPYFMINEEWFEPDEDKNIIVLTDKAPKEDPKVMKSYKEYVKNHISGQMCLGGSKLDFDIDNDKEFEKYINKLINSD